MAVYNKKFNIVLPDGRTETWSQEDMEQYGGDLFAKYAGTKVTSQEDYQEGATYSPESTYDISFADGRRQQMSDAEWQVNGEGIRTNYPDAKISVNSPYYADDNSDLLRKVGGIKSRTSAILDATQKMNNTPEDKTEADKKFVRDFESNIADNTYENRMRREMYAESQEFSEFVTDEKGNVDQDKVKQFYDIKAAHREMDDYYNSLGNLSGLVDQRKEAFGKNATILDSDIDASMQNIDAYVNSIMANPNLTNEERSSVLTSYNDIKAKRLRTEIGELETEGVRLAKQGKKAEVDAIKQTLEEKRQQLHDAESQGTYSKLAFDFDGAIDVINSNLGDEGSYLDRTNAISQLILRDKAIRTILPKVNGLQEAFESLVDVDDSVLYSVARELYHSAKDTMTGSVGIDNGSKFMELGTSFKEEGKSWVNNPNSLLNLAGAEHAIDMQIRRIAMKLQAYGANLNDTELESATLKDAGLTDGESALWEAYMSKMYAETIRKDDRTYGQKGAKISMDAIPFMMEMMVTHNITTGATRDLEAFMMKGLHKLLNKEAAVGTNMLLQGLTRYGGHYAANLASRMIQTGVGVGLAQSTANAKGRALIETNPDGTLKYTAQQANRRGYLDNYKEWFTEIAGEQYGKWIGDALHVTHLDDFFEKYVTANISSLGHDWLKYFNRGKALTMAGFNGFGEIAEEIEGALIDRVVFGDEESWEEFWKKDNLVEMLIGFAPMMVFGGAMSGAQAGYHNYQINKNMSDAQRAYMEAHPERNWTNSQWTSFFKDLSAKVGADGSIKGVADQLRQFEESYQDIVINNSSTLSDQEKIDRMESAQALGKALLSEVAITAQNQAMRQQEMEDMRDAIQDGTGQRFWRNDGDGNYVTTGTFTNSDGSMFDAYILSENGDEIAWVDNQGKRGISKRSALSEMQSHNLDEYLGSVVDYNRQANEQNRMNAERQSNLARLTKALATDPKITTTIEGQQVEGQFVGWNNGKGLVSIGDNVIEMSVEEMARGLAEPFDASVYTNEQIARNNADKAILRNNLNERFAGKEITIDGKPVRFRKIYQSPFLDENGKQNVYVVGYDENGMPQRYTVPVSELENQVGRSVTTENESPAASSTGNALPMKADADGNQVVDESALWQRSVAEWADYNTKKQNDGGVDSWNYVNGVAIPLLSNEIAELENSLSMEADFGARENIKNDILAKRQRLQELKDYQKKAVADAIAPLNTNNTKVVISTSETITEDMENAGCSNKSISQVRRGMRIAMVPAFYDIETNTVFMVADNAKSIEDVKVSFVHEDQHRDTNDNGLAVALLEKMGGATEENYLRLSNAVATLSDSQFYTGKDAVVLADEFISYAVETAFKSGQDVRTALESRGVNDDFIINFVENIDNEREEARAAAARLSQSAGNVDNGLRERVGGEADGISPNGGSGAVEGQGSGSLGAGEEQVRFAVSDLAQARILDFERFSIDNELNRFHLTEDNREEYHALRQKRNDLFQKVIKGVETPGYEAICILNTSKEEIQSYGLSEETAKEVFDAMWYDQSGGICVRATDGTFKTFVFTENKRSLEDGIGTYRHESRHQKNKCAEGNANLKAIIRAANSNQSLLYDLIRELGGDDVAYKNQFDQWLNGSKATLHSYEWAMTSIAEEVSAFADSKIFKGQSLAEIFIPLAEKYKGINLNDLINAVDKAATAEYGEYNYDPEAGRYGGNREYVSGDSRSNREGKGGESFNELDEQSDRPVQDGGSSVESGRMGDAIARNSEESSQERSQNDGILEEVESDPNYTDEARQFLIEEQNTIEAPADATGDEIRFTIREAQRLEDKSVAFWEKTQKYLTEDELKTANGFIATMASIMEPYLDARSEGKRVLPEEVFGKGYTTIFNNGSYGRTMENTTKCLRTLSYNDFVDAVKEQLGRPLTTIESFLASQMLYDIAVDPQCLYCYVSLDRKAYDDFLLRFIQDRDKALEAYRAADIDPTERLKPQSKKKGERKDPKYALGDSPLENVYKAYLDGREDSPNQRERFNTWLDAETDPNKRLVSLEDLTTEEKRSSLKQNEEKYFADQIADAEKYAQGASWAKKQEDYRSYNGELLEMSPRVVNMLRNEYGLRFYSFSEYSPAFIVENMQMVRDASLRGLNGLGYTKELDFVRVFAPTGMNINMSCFGRWSEDGQMIMDTRQGADWNEVKELREKYPNAGAVFVATDDAMVEWALDQDWIDVIIPFHIVRTGTEVSKFYEWVNHSMMQADTNTFTGRNQDIMPTEHHNDKNTFLALCASHLGKDGSIQPLKPRFADLVLPASGQSVVAHPNYMKLVNETRRSIDETTPLKPVFDLASAVSSFDEFVERGGYYGDWYTVDTEGYKEAVNQVVEDIKAGRTAKDVDYGRQDIKMDPEKLSKAARRQRQHRQHGNTPLTQVQLTEEQKDSIKFRISEARKQTMASQITNKLSFMTDEQVKATIAEIERLGEQSKKGGDSKMENSLLDWVCRGMIVLPEDEEKAILAYNYAKRFNKNTSAITNINAFVDLMSTEVQKREADKKPLDPDTVPEFTNKTVVSEAHGIVVYDVPDSKEGQRAVRNIVDSHFGYSANPWCLISRLGDGDSLKQAWGYWKNYSGAGRKIAFQNGKLIAFMSSASPSEQWWDRLDRAHTKVPVMIKFNTDGGKVTAQTKVSASDADELVYDNIYTVNKGNIEETYDAGGNLVQTKYSAQRDGMKESVTIDYTRMGSRLNNPIEQVKRGDTTIAAEVKKNDSFKETRRTSNGDDIQINYRLWDEGPVVTSIVLQRGRFEATAKVDFNPGRQYADKPFSPSNGELIYAEGITEDEFVAAIREVGIVPSKSSRASTINYQENDAVATFDWGRVGKHCVKVTFYRDASNLSDKIDAILQASTVRVEGFIEGEPYQVNVGLDGKPIQFITDMTQYEALKEYCDRFPGIFERADNYEPRIVDDVHASSDVDSNRIRQEVDNINENALSPEKKTNRAANALEKIVKAYKSAKALNDPMAVMMRDEMTDDIIWFARNAREAEGNAKEESRRRMQAWAERYAGIDETLQGIANGTDDSDSTLYFDNRYFNYISSHATDHRVAAIAALVDSYLFAQIDNPWAAAAGEALDWLDDARMSWVGDIAGLREKYNEWRELADNETNIDELDAAELSAYNAIIDTAIKLANDVDAERQKAQAPRKITKNLRNLGRFVEHIDDTDPGEMERIAEELGIHGIRLGLRNDQYYPRELYQNMTNSSNPIERSMVKIYEEVYNDRHGSMTFNAGHIVPELPKEISEATVMGGSFTYGELLNNLEQSISGLGALALNNATPEEINAARESIDNLEADAKTASMEVLREFTGLNETKEVPQFSEKRNRIWEFWKKVADAHHWGEIESAELEHRTLLEELRYETYRELAFNIMDDEALVNEDPILAEYIALYDFIDDPNDLWDRAEYDPSNILEWLEPISKVDSALYDKVSAASQEYFGNEDADDETAMGVINDIISERYNELRAQLDNFTAPAADVGIDTKASIYGLLMQSKSRNISETEIEKTVGAEVWNEMQMNGGVYGNGYIKVDSDLATHIILNYDDEFADAVFVNALIGDEGREEYTAGEILDMIEERSSDNRNATLHDICEHQQDVLAELMEDENFPDNVDDGEILAPFFGYVDDQFAKQNVSVPVNENMQKVAANLASVLQPKLAKMHDPVAQKIYDDYQSTNDGMAFGDALVKHFDDLKTKPWDEAIRFRMSEENATFDELSNLIGSRLNNEGEGTETNVVGEGAEGNPLADLSRTGEDGEIRDILFRAIGEEGAQNLDNAGIPSGRAKSRMENLALAISYKGNDPLTIKKLTGWEFSDGQWKYEEPDFLVSDLNLEDGKKLSEVIDDKSLFVAYPQLSDIEIRLVNNGNAGVAYDNYIEIDPNYSANGHTKEQEQRLTLIHEIQHKIQEYEGWPTGTSMDNPDLVNAVDAALPEFKNDLWDIVKKTVAVNLNLRPKYEGREATTAFIDKWGIKPTRALGSLGDLRDALINAAYRNNRGEIDARISEARADYSEEELNASLRDEQNIRFSVRTKPAPEKTGIGYKVFYQKEGKLYPPMVANPNGADTPVGVWLDADAAPVAGSSKTGRPQVKQGGKGTQGGSGMLAYRPGWHLGEIPYALQFNRKDENGERTLFPKDFVWAEVEYAMDNNYQEEAEAEGMTENGKFRHSYAGLKRVPEDGYYTYRTNPNPETDPWIITGSMKVNRILDKSEVDELVRNAGREPQRVEGDGVRFKAGPVAQMRMKGMAEYLGEKMTDFTNTVITTKDIFTKEQIDEISEEALINGADYNYAINQFFARLAEKDQLSADELDAAQKVANILAKYVGVEEGDITANDYLWFAYNEAHKDDNSIYEQIHNQRVRRSLNEGTSVAPEMSLEDYLAAAAKAKDDLVAQYDAMKAITREMDNINAAMGRRANYDRNTVGKIVALADSILESHLMDNATNGEVKRLMGVIRRATGMRNIQSRVNELYNLILSNHLRNLNNMFDKEMKKKATKVNSNNVVEQSALDVDGQRIMTAFKDNMESMTEENGTIVISSSLRDKIAESLEKTTSDDSTEAHNAEMELMGLSMAREYIENIKANEFEEKSVRDEMKRAEEAHKKGEMADKAYRQFMKESRKALVEIRTERVNNFTIFLQKMQDRTAASHNLALQFVRQQKERVEQIHHDANSDMKGIPSNEHPQKPTFLQEVSNNAFVQFFFRPLSNFNQMLRLFGYNAVNGEGYLWNRFIRGWVDAAGNESKGKQSAFETLDKKMSEVMGRKMKWSDIYAVEERMPKVTVSFWDGGEMMDHELTQGNLLYILLADQMTDGRMKLRAMGITEEHVDAIRKQMDPRFLTLADWVVNEFLPARREVYNAVHERMFGAPMSKVENYFPLKVLANARTQQVDVASANADPTTPSIVTGNIMKRTRNSLALDLLRADAFSMVVEHMEKMEHWAAFAEWNRDLSDLLSYKNFRNHVQNMTSIYGSQVDLWKEFVDTAMVAAGSYRGEAGKLDNVLNKMAKGVTAAKIALRVFTAIKQFLSFPAYFAEANPMYLAEGLYKGWNWSMDNLPLFEKRWKSRQAGDHILAEGNLGRINEALARIGMAPNAAVDAFTVSIGAYAIYKTKYDRYIKMGYAEDEADRRAKQDATIFFNETQQSSEAIFMSTMQSGRSSIEKMFSVFRNSSMGYQRIVHGALRNYKRRSTPGYRKESIEFVAKQLVRDGLSERQALNAARGLYQRQGAKDALRLLIFGYGLQFLWSLAPYLPYLFFGGDDDKKKEMLIDAAQKGVFGSLEGLTGGNLISEAGNRLVFGEGFKDLKDWDPTLLPLVSDFKNITQELGSDRVRALNDIINLGVQAFVGVNPQTLEDGIIAVLDACHGELDTATEVLMLALRLSNAPQSSLDELFIDEVNMTALEASNLTIPKLAERYAEYKKTRGAGAMAPLYSLAPELDKKITDKYLDSFNSRVTEKLTDAEINRRFFDLDEESKKIEKKLEDLRPKAHSGNEEAREELMRILMSPDYGRSVRFKGMYDEYKDAIKQAVVAPKRVLMYEHLYKADEIRNRIYEEFDANDGSDAWYRDRFTQYAKGILPEMYQLDKKYRGEYEENQEGSRQAEIDAVNARINANTERIADIDVELKKYVIVLSNGKKKYINQPARRKLNAEKKELQAANRSERSMLSEIKKGNTPKDYMPSAIYNSPEFQIYLEMKPLGSVNGNTFTFKSISELKAKMKAAKDYETKSKYQDMIDERMASLGKQMTDFLDGVEGEPNEE